MDKKPLFALLTDTHATRDNLEAVNNTFEQLYNWCLDRRVYTVVHMGDWFTDRSGQSLACSLLVKKWIKKLIKAGIEWWTFPGNHDKPDLDKDESYLTLFEDIEGFNVYSKAGTHKFSKNIHFHFLPYYKDDALYLNGLSSLIDALDTEKYNILFTHASINGVRNNDGSLVDGELEVNYFDNFDVVYVGHYHDEQKIEPNIHYIGSDRQQNYGEKDGKGFKAIYPDGTCTHQPLNYKSYKKVIIDASNQQQAVKELMNFETMKETGVAPNLRIIFKGTREQVETLDISKYKEAGIDVKRENVSEAVLFENIDEAEFTVLDKKGVAKGWLEYCDLVGIEGKKKTTGLKMLSNLNFAK